ncbi:MAG: hypothetical protein SXA11_18045 [Cyanobacteriota bacterium]|nr:hypothetical protein [Cyanobacteriota bacterium]
MSPRSQEKVAPPKPTAFEERSRSVADATIAFLTSPRSKKSDRL